MALLLLAACSGNPLLGDNCAKVFCGADQFCLSTSGGAGDPGDTADSAGSEDPFGDLPVCTQAPAECGPIVTCACLPDCTTCEKSGGLIRCTIETP